MKKILDKIFKVFSNEEGNRLDLFKKIAVLTIIVFAVVALILTLFIFLSGKGVKKQVEKQDKSQITSKLPITKEGFRIGYDPKRSPVIAVEILAKDEPVFSNRKKAASDALYQLGATDLCALEVRFIPINQELREMIDKKEIFPEGCPLPDWAK